MPASQPKMSKGARFMLLAVFFFGIMAASAKALFRLAPEETSLFRAFLMIFLSLFFIQKKGASALGEAKNRGFLAARGLLGGTALIFYFWSLQLLPLATATIIFYVSPMLTALFAHWLLAEKLSKRAIFFFLFSFAGVVLVREFDPRVSAAGLACGLASAVLSAGAYTAVSKLKGKEQPMTLVFYQSVAAAGLSAAVLFARKSWAMPEGIEWLWLTMTTIFAFLGQFFMTRAFFEEKSQTVAILNYTGIVFALGYGWLFWGETFGWQALAGMAMVLAGVVLHLRFDGGKKPSKTQD